MKISLKVFTASVLMALMSIASAEVVSVNIGGTQSWDVKGDPSNEMKVIDVAALLGRSGTQVTLTGVGWNVVLDPQNGGWYSEQGIAFNGGNDKFPGMGVNGDQGPMMFTSGGVQDFTDANPVAEPDIVLPDGMLTLEFYSTFGGDNNNINGTFVSGTISFEAVPPSAGDLLGVVTQPGVGLNTLAMESQLDGKVVVAGYNGQNGNDFFVGRYNDDASIDNTFGVGGFTSSDFGGASNDQGYDVKLQSDGKIVVAGTSNGDFALARYTSAGVLDVTFGFNGLVKTDNAGLVDFGAAVAIQPDDKIVVAGYSTDAMPQSDFVVLRYLANGTLDTVFGTNGITTTPIANLTNDQALSVAIQPDGKILLAGTSGANFALTRYTSTGALDPTFSGTGKLTTNVNGMNTDVRGIALQNDGKIVVSGYADVMDQTTVNCILSNMTQCLFKDFILVRYFSSGTLDNTFNGTGIVTTNINVRGNDDLARAVIIQPDGKIIQAGTSDTSDRGNGMMPPPQEFDVSLVRYNANGTLDASFSTDGKVISSGAPFVMGEFEAIEDLVLSPDGDNQILGAVNYLGGPKTGLVGYAGDFTPVPQTASGDMTGDKKSDILWRNVGSGQNYLYTMNGATITASSPINTIADQNWVIVGKGDYNGDLKTDILWRNSATGENFMYLMNGAAIMTPRQVNILPDQNWKVRGNGDFDQDNKADVLWRNTATGQVYLYLMDGATIKSQNFVANVPDQSWKIVGNDDHTGDGKADILWRNVATGQNYLYEMNGAAIVSSKLINTVADQNWQIVGSGDYNGDKRADILWRNAATGQNFLYLMDGKAITAALAINTVADLNWKIVATDDYNGDGKSDILWRNSFTGQNYLYQMNGNIIMNASQVNVVPGASWQVINTN